MRRVEAWIAIGPLLAAGCGGKVVFETDVGGAGGQGGSAQHGTTTSTHASSSTSASKSSSVATSTGTGASCPDPLPVTASCSVEGQTCPVNLSCCNVAAVCKAGIWQASPPGCASPCGGPCGPDGFACAAGAICVAYLATTTTYECRVDPCTGPLDCSCAKGMCAEQGLTCNNIQGGDKVLCD